MYILLNLLDQFCLLFSIEFGSYFQLSAFSELHQISLIYVAVKTFFFSYFKFDRKQFHCDNMLGGEETWGMFAATQD